MPRRLVDIPTLAQTFTAATRRIVPKTATPCAPDILGKVSLWQGDITELSVDVIVNAANRRLLGGGGVDGAIHRAAGSGLLAECRTLGGASTGESKITKGYKLPARHVIHTVGPVYTSYEPEDSEELLSSCYASSLKLATMHNLTSIAFPSISTGIYGYPVRQATNIALRETRDFLESDEGQDLSRVVFVVFSDEDWDVYEELLPLHFPPPESTEIS